MVPPDSDRVSPAPSYSGSLPDYVGFTYRAFTFCGAAFQSASIHRCNRVGKSYNPIPGKPRMVWAVSRSLATTWEITIVFCSFRYLDVSVPGVCLHAIGVDIPINRDGLPHSDTRGSTLLCSSPRIFAAWHVLHRLCMPRHPPYALFYFYLHDLHNHSGRQSMQTNMSSIFLPRS